MIERIHNIESVQRVDGKRIDGLEEGSQHLWEDLKELAKIVGNIRVDVAKIVVFSTMAQTIIVAVVVYFITKGSK
jgi:hypothetical protein